jgi:hypothetical protein
VDPLWSGSPWPPPATLLAQAALAKLADRALFEQHLAAYGVPHALLGRRWPAVPLAEAARRWRC